MPQSHPKSYASEVVTPTEFHSNPGWPLNIPENGFESSPQWISDYCSDSRSMREYHQHPLSLDLLAPEDQEISDSCCPTSLSTQDGSFIPFDDYIPQPPPLFPDTQPYDNSDLLPVELTSLSDSSWSKAQSTNSADSPGLSEPDTSELSVQAEAVSPPTSDAPGEAGPTDATPSAGDGSKSPGIHFPRHGKLYKIITEEGRSYCRCLYVSPIDHKFCGEDILFGRNWVRHTSTKHGKKEIEKIEKGKLSEADAIAVHDPSFRIAMLACTERLCTYLRDFGKHWVMVGSAYRTDRMIRKHKDDYHKGLPDSKCVQTVKWLRYEELGVVHGSKRTSSSGTRKTPTKRKKGRKAAKQKAATAAVKCDEATLPQIPGPSLHPSGAIPRETRAGKRKRGESAANLEPNAPENALDSSPRRKRTKCS